MGNVENQKIVHKFLCEHLKSQLGFTKADLFKGTTWGQASQDTYWSKQFSQFVKKESKGTYKVNRRFGLYLSWDKFQKDIVTQNRDADTSWKLESFKAVLNFEFFMPLAHEVLLRKLLDDIFYHDSLQILFGTIDESGLKKRFPCKSGESPEAYKQRLSTWVSEKFGGYSISHVSGRFRAQEAAKFMTAGDSYLIDETTAVVRFIIPCGEGVPDEWDDDERPLPKNVLSEAADIRWFFHELFVKSMLDAVRGEKQIWMLESGLFRRLHIWSLSS
jgi:hypothetical protein